jgi:hypothetical protein
MKRRPLISFLWYVAIVAVSVGYLAFVAPYVPEMLAIPLSIVLIPFLIGCAAYLLLHAPLLLKVLLVAAIPFVHVLVFGGDPAKPGLEYYIAIAEGIVMLLGLLACFAVANFRSRRPASQ